MKAKERFVLSVLQTVRNCGLLFQVRRERIGGNAWDDDDTNDEQWPYQVRFGNTNLLGHANVITSVALSSEDNIQFYSEENRLFINDMPQNANVQVFNLAGRCLINKNGSGISFSTLLTSGIYIVTIQTEHGTFNRKVIIR